MPKKIEQLKSNKDKKATPAQLAYLDILMDIVKQGGEQLPDDIQLLIQEEEISFREASLAIIELKYLLGWEE